MQSVLQQEDVQEVPLSVLQTLDALDALRTTAAPGGLLDALHLLCTNDSGA